MPSDSQAGQDARERDARERTMCGRDVSGQARSRVAASRGGVPRAIASTRTKIPAVRSIISDSGDSGEPSSVFIFETPVASVSCDRAYPTTPAPRVVAIETRMALTDTTNVADRLPGRSRTAALKASRLDHRTEPGETRHRARCRRRLDAAARDDATAKLEAAAFQDAAGLCIALLGVASDSGCASARRLAAATFTRTASGSSGALATRRRRALPRG